MEARIFISDRRWYQLLLSGRGYVIRDKQEGGKLWRNLILEKYDREDKEGNLSSFKSYISARAGRSRMERYVYCGAKLEI